MKGTMEQMVTITPIVETLSGLLNRGKEQASASHRQVLVSLAQPFQGENSPLEIFLNSVAKGTASTFWGKPDHDFWMAGNGIAAILAAEGDNRVNRIKEQTHELLSSDLVEAPPVRGVGPVFIGGFRYDTKVKRDEIWRNFPDALLTLPRFLFTCSNSETWLTVNALVEQTTNVSLLAEALAADLQSVIGSSARADCQPLIKHIEQTSREEWHENVRSALRAIDAGELTKVVLSRRKILHGNGNFSLDNVLRRLCTEYPECTIFAICNGGASFIGATPEMLASVDRRKLSVACLASSAARGSNPEDDKRLQTRLLESQKERAEHSAVTEMVADALKDMCRELSRDVEPQLLKLKNIQHLVTCFTGKLQPGVDILDVVKRLHPTPAVAGVPTDRGLNLIGKLEGDRGWYAAPVGWLDRNGEGEFAVAIRSALIDGGKALLQAGCGIVDGSDPEREYEETELKFKPLLTVLGAD